MFMPWAAGLSVFRFRLLPSLHQVYVILFSESGFRNYNKNSFVGSFLPLIKNPSFWEEKRLLESSYKESESNFFLILKHRKPRHALWKAGGKGRSYSSNFGRFWTTGTRRLSCEGRICYLSHGNPSFSSKYSFKRKSVKTDAVVVSQFYKSN